MRSILDAARQWPDADALVADGYRMSFAELARAARAELEAWRDRGVGPGDRVALVARRTPRDVARIHAALALRATLVPIHARLEAGERATRIHRARPRLVVDGDRVTAGEGGGATPPCADGEPPFAIVHTSGTSGPARGVVLSRSAFEASARASEANLGFREGDRWLLCMPLAHVGGLSIVVRTLLAGACTALVPEGRFDPASLAGRIDRDHVTLCSLVPTMLDRLLALEPAWHPPAHLRAVLLGGAAAPGALLGRAADRGVPVLTTYGLTEACSQVTAQRAGTRQRGELGAGPPLPGLSVRIVDGVIEVRGPTLLEGYWPLEEGGGPPLEDGWLRTGDLGELDADGNFHVFGRADDVIVTGGENVHPLEVERVLSAHPAVSAACVFGVPDPTWGQVVAAAVSGEGVRVADVLGFAAERLAAHQRPRHLVVTHRLPETPAGKPDRRAAGQMYAPKVSRSPQTLPSS